MIIALSMVDTNVDTLLTNPSMELSASLLPKWLDHEFLLKHLQKYYNDRKLNIQSFQVKSATAKGENYASSIYRVTLQFVDGHQHKDHNLNIIIKTALAGEFAFDTLSECDVYNKEIDFYKRIAPRINLLLKQLNENDQLLAENYGVSGTNKAILFEDLTLKGYRLSSIQRGFDISATKMILRKSATLHACNAVIQQQEPHFFESFKHGLISRATDKLDRFYLTQFDAVVEVVSKWPEFVSYAVKLKNIRANLMEKGRKAFDADPNHFNTLIHGDMWTNNMMMKYVNEIESKECGQNEQSILENMVYLDFQFSCWTSPTIDLHYFFNTSLEETLRTHHIDELIQFYHKHLCELLKQLNYRNHIPTLQEFKKQFRDKSFYGFVASCLIQPIMLNEHTENADFEALVLGDERSIEFKRVIYSSPKIQANLKRLIPFYDRLGAFD